MRLSTVVDRLNEIRDVLDNGYYSERDASFKLGVIMERIEVLSDDLDEAIAKRQWLNRQKEEENDSGTSNT